MAKGLSRIALIVATIAVVMLISSCSDVTESSQSSNKEKSVTSLVGEYIMATDILFLTKTVCK